MTKLPTLRELLDAGVHFGHKTSRWNPKMVQNIFTSKSGVHVINLEKTLDALGEACEFLAKSSSEGKTILFVGTKKQAQEIIKKEAILCGMPYATERWLGGLLTNFLTVKKASDKLKSAKERQKSGEYLKLSTRDKVKLDKEIEKREVLVGGLIDLVKKPDVLILIGAHDEKNALNEANYCGIPTVALVDTNSDPDNITYPIPANDDATKSIELFARLFSRVILENKKKDSLKNKP